MDIDPEPFQCRFDHRTDPGRLHPDRRRDRAAVTAMDVSFSSGIVLLRVKRHQGQRPHRPAATVLSNTLRREVEDPS